MDAPRRVRYRRPPLKPYQLAAFFHLLRYAWIEGTTKCGKTHSGIVWLFEQALTGKFKNYWWVAPTYKAAKIAYTRMAAALPKHLRKLNDTDLTITVPGGHVIWFLSGEKPDNLYGEDVGAVVIDEASRMREEAWFAIRSVVTFTQGKIRAIGNVKGRRNWFFKKCREAEAAMASSTPTNAHWALITAAMAVEAGILPQAEIDDAKANLPEAVFLELYYGIPTENGSNPFGLKHIAAAATLDGPTGLPVACTGLDLARAADWLVLIGLDADGAVAAFDRFQKPWEEAYRDIYAFTDPDGAPTLVDSTGIGDPILARLQKDRPHRFLGYRFSASSKQKLMEGLAVAIQKGEVRIPKTGPIRNELEQFEFENTPHGVRYSAPEGFHDDCVMALALAVAARTKTMENETNRIYPAWGKAQELAGPTEWHAAQWNAGLVRIAALLRPDDRLPWAALWVALYPNEDAIAFQEWPQFDYESCRASPVSDVEGYRKLLLASEKAIGRDVDLRLIAPKFAEPLKTPGAQSVRQLLAGPCAECVAFARRGTYDDVEEQAEAVAQAAETCKHRLFFIPVAGYDENQAHLSVRAALGDAASGVRPRLYAIKETTPNFCAGMARYAWVENKNQEDGPSQKPQPVFQTFPELIGLGYFKRFQRWPAPEAAPPNVSPRRLFAPRLKPRATGA